ncbi:MAG: hypothetical protein KA040_02915 [Aliarcobacter sp.]|nr:hypothetical protein [Aliarcobacter sp.]MBP7784025.1 hypothetical protein [Aliarcobacter sp.]
MKDNFSLEKNIKESLHEKTSKIHKNLWKIYFTLVLIGILFISIKGLVDA